MTNQLLFYQNAVPVTTKMHGDVSVRSGDNYSFARNINSVPLTAVEFAAAAAHYPIVFAGTEEKVMPAVILGLSGNDNFYVEDDGIWSASYIPAFVRRFPFVFSTDSDNRNFILHIDESFEGVNREGRGERLFNSDGNQTQYLKGILRFLQDYQSQFRRTEAYCSRLVDLELLQPMQAQFNLPGGERRSLAGFSAINRQKLKEIDADTLRSMFETDELECTFLHLHSVRHFNDMLVKLGQSARRPAEAEEPADSTAEAEEVIEESE